ncbi:MAG: ArsR/SmtB family transcription factor [Acutalibacteraceae bacterium]
MEEINALAEEFKACQKALSALGDENRQHLILQMMKMGRCSGVRVGEISKRTNLSRPAVSRHLQILKDAGLINMRREGTKNYYYFDSDTQVLERLLRLFIHTKEIMELLPDRSGENI